MKISQVKLRRVIRTVRISQLTLLRDHGESGRMTMDMTRTFPTSLQSVMVVSIRLRKREWICKGRKRIKSAQVLMSVGPCFQLVFHEVCFPSSVRFCFHYHSFYAFVFHLVLAQKEKTHCTYRVFLSVISSHFPICTIPLFLFSVIIVVFFHVFSLSVAHFRWLNNLSKVLFEGNKTNQPHICPCRCMILKKIEELRNALAF